ncbi:MAG: hypothetical protein RO469_13505 [Thermincola sp.]|nr:hypothetical protein [Thermincola sp.]MDT3703726.1 hypothetical protein [Thermincola sp.]
MKSKSMFVLFFLVFSIYFIFSLQPTPNESKYPLGGHSFENGKKISLSASGYDFKRLYTGEKQYQLMDKQWFKWEVSKNRKTIGYITITQDAVYNGDFYYLARYEPLTDSKQPFILNITLSGSTSPFYENHAEYPKGIDMTESVWQGRQSARAHLSKYTAVVENKQYSMWMSLAYVYRQRERGVLEELYNKVLPIRNDNRGNFSIYFPQHKGTVSEQWSVVSASPLIDWNHKLAQTNLRMADLNRARKWSEDGMYFITPTTYVPYAPNFFWRIPAQYVGELFIRSEGARVFETFGIVSMYTAVNTLNKDGYWASTPRSTMLYDDYKIDGGFYDTRFNTDTALFMIRAYNKFKDQDALNVAKTYGGFLINYMKTHSFKTKNGGLLVCDYGNFETPLIKTHMK